MTTAVRGFGAFRAYLEMIKIEHSIFALPFAMIGMMWASMSLGQGPWPGWWTFGWIVVAMVSCRSAAMAFNRIADRMIDAANPRTKGRHIPAGILSMRHASVFFWGSVALFVVSAAMLNPLALALSPIALVVVLGYSNTKRFTYLCHFVLGLGLGIAPAAAWVAVTGTVGWPIVLLTAAVMFWTAGFDILYALQDEEFDRRQGLRSIPADFGRVAAIRFSRASHALAVLFLAAAVYAVGSGVAAYLGVLAAAALLAYEQSLVKPNDLSKIDMAFFAVNGFVSIGLFAFVLVDVLMQA
ncbi:MAG: UbiA-like polyprenyltransferase [Fimbriimonadaceae bacterium]